MLKQFTEHRTVHRLKRHWLTIAFLLGFVVDNITLNRVDQLFDNVILATYVVLAMVSLLLLYMGTSERVGESRSVFLKKYAPLLVQFSFGGLLSGILIFYGRSGDWLVSWPFLVVILLVIYFNETIKDRAPRLHYNLAILFIGLLAYLVLVVPVFTGFMGPWVFVGSTLLALVIMYGFVQLLYKVVPRFLDLHMRGIVFMLGTIFAAFNFLYFTNIIPPIPLSLKDVGIYHEVTRSADGIYQLTYEDGAWWQPFKDSDKVFRTNNNSPVFCFARVFAPTRLQTDIVHVWEYYDPDLSEWIERSRLQYSISGGRGDGFRGYTRISSYETGTWRCSVETARGQVLGRETFTTSPDPRERDLVTRLE